MIVPILEGLHYILHKLSGFLKFFNVKFKMRFTIIIAQI